jgi:chromosomal replication initiator protein
MSADPDVQSLWLDLVERVSNDERITPSNAGFLSLVEPKGVIDQTLYLEVPNEFTRNMIDQSMRPIITEHMQGNAEFSGPVNFATVINPEIQSSIALNISESASTTDNAGTEIKSQFSRTAEADRSTAANGFDTRLNPRYTFDNFVTGGSNRFAHAAAFAVAESPAKAYNPLFIYGSSGLGKTHLLHAIGHYAMSMYPRIKVRYVSSEEFTNDFINSIQNNTQKEFQSRYREIDILLIDDIQFLQGKDQTQEAFFQTFNALHEHNKQLVITSDKQPSDLNGFEVRMVSRFEWGLKTDIQAPELETRIAILRKKAENEKVKIDQDILEYVAARVASNVRELEGTLIRLIAYANLNRHTVDMATAQTVLKDLVPLGQTSITTPAEILEIVCRFYQLTKDDINGSSRVKAVAMARQIAMYLCREMTDLSLPKIGELFGRDHTTVMYACKKVSEMMRERHYVYNQVTEMIERIRGQQNAR